MKYRLLILILVLIVIPCLIGCGNPYKSEEAIEYLKEFEYIKEEFIDKYELAETTSRIVLSPVISEMQDSKRDLSKLSPPEKCERFSAIQELCLQGMDKAIEGFQEFQMENEIEALSLLVEADRIFIDVDNAINEIREESNK